MLAKRNGTQNEPNRRITVRYRRTAIVWPSQHEGSLRIPSVKFPFRGSFGLQTNRAGRSSLTRPGLRSQKQILRPLAIISRIAS